MRKFIVTVSTNKVGSECSETIEVEDDATDAEIEEQAREAIFNMIEWNWQPAK